MMSTSHGSSSTRDVPFELKTVDTASPSDAHRVDHKDTPQVLLEYTAYLGRCIAGVDDKPTITSVPKTRRK
ncbi:hypothetical protein G647_06127 [Cladophialophora carrionii CBS 160.54]|uniref:Uncharacterized protein n=1 Tax=Cladophialophora carrionii CBS 160.54 TaxID=1279043 RepID=V9D5X2_9EURO|nr:uncharacterized protein G647_06127 [Cladophialophora carrionii CBS 160.54]ETI22056.1 hypothetical protein G647_06127 [Cladophialophora carrionii CBS 160.54]